MILAKGANKEIEKSLKEQAHLNFIMHTLTDVRCVIRPHVKLEVKLYETFVSSVHSYAIRLLQLLLDFKCNRFPFSQLNNTIDISH